ncbi:unnamed protein product [Rotaria socialis]
MHHQMLDKQLFECCQSTESLPARFRNCSIVKFIIDEKAPDIDLINTITYSIRQHCIPIRLILNRNRRPTTES